MIVSGEDVAKFVSDSLGIGFCPPYTAMGIEKGGRIVAGVIFNCFEGADVHVSLAGKGWTRTFIEAVGQYVFCQLECQRMTCITESEKVAQFAVRLGGQYEGRLRSHFGYGRDGIIAGILRDEFRSFKVRP